ncbi:fructosamine-3-kinase [Sulfuritortus calidifontis]|uniref:Fructosamine-3-kinase n=1 Tax=Sulfuritortus calidifontis TaxID=1914471 RepID=A0A4R3K038_9PROT|nr:fructosamine kinase family protein [Sulfuritortus calidifontis]TCS73288.1 fructosamine-3-kinase [Sulfuritortus calidifontis]
MTAWVEIGAAIAGASGQPFQLGRHEHAGGGCINEAYVLHGRAGERFFLKLNEAAKAAMFEAEAAGLDEILASRRLRAPRPICWGTAGGQAYLVLEHLDLSGRGSGTRLGRHLAAMHRVSQARFGWRIDNSIGDTPQPNTPCADWVEFWRDRRLHHQLRLAARNGAGRRLIDQGERLMSVLAAFFTDYRPAPSLLHGDLWGGNYGFADGEPVVFDPAVYYGDREADLAMTELFGGFGPDFYAAYREAWPLDPGYPVRKILYNLYHVLNHFNMFGGAYAGQAEAMIGRLLAEIGQAH